MPVAAVDFFLASVAMILLVIGAISGVSTVVEPYLEVDGDHTARYQQIGRYMLLSKGVPENWGVGSVPTALGFASTGGVYDLDIDKVTRLNPSNVYAVNYPQLWIALNIDDVSFRIRVDTLFNITCTLVTTQPQGENTTYTFSTSTMRQGYPLPAEVRYYVEIGDYTYAKTGSTDINGSGTVDFTLPNSLNGTALLIGFARVEQGIVSYGVLPFAHNSPSPEPAGTFASLSPLNYTLNIDLEDGATIVNATVFSYNYMFNLTGNGGSYSIPRLRDPSPMVLVLTGVNGSTYWAEWTTYPQIPLVVGADMSDSRLVSDVALVSYLIEVKGALYRFEVRFRSPAQYD